MEKYRGIFIQRLKQKVKTRCTYAFGVLAEVILTFVIDVLACGKVDFCFASLEVKLDDLELLLGFEVRRTAGNLPARGAHRTMSKE